MILNAIKNEKITTTSFQKFQMEKIKYYTRYNFDAKLSKDTVDF